MIDFYFYIFKATLFYTRNLWSQIEVDSYKHRKMNRERYIQVLLRK